MTDGRHICCDRVVDLKDQNHVLDGLSSWEVQLLVGDETYRCFT